MGKNDENKKVIETTTVEDKDNKPEDNAGEQTPPAEGTTKEPEKDGFFKKVGSGIKKVGNGIKTGTKKVLDYKFSIGQVLGAAVVIGGAIIGGKMLYDKGRKDGEGFDDENLLDNDDEMLELPGGTEEVIDVKPDEAEEELEVYGEPEFEAEEEVYEEDMTEE